MLLLIFYLGEERYALDSLQIAEIIPLVNFRKIFQVPDYVLGMFNYRGAIVPAIDLGLLIQGTPCRSRLSSRIIMVNYPFAGGKTYPLGLIAERVTDTLGNAEKNWVPNNFQGKNTAYLGEVIMDDRGMIQRLRLESLLSGDQQSVLMAGYSNT